MSDSSFAPADYNPTGMPQYDGNPLIECLPKILSDVDVVRRIGSAPPRPDNVERALDPKLRGHGINRLKDVVVPFEIHLRLEDLFSQLIRSDTPGAIHCMRHPLGIACPLLRRSRGTGLCPPLKR